MKKPDISLLLETATLAAVEAGKGVMQVYRSDDFEIITKSDQSPVTRADIMANAIIGELLAKTGLPLLSEEGKAIPYELRKDWEYFWLADPLDGTKGFISKNGEFTINIALMHRNTPAGGVIYAPDTETLYFGSRATGIYRKLNHHTTRLTPSPHRISMSELLAKEEITIVASRSHLTPETASFISRFKQVRLESMGSSLKFMLLIEDKADLYPRLATTMEWDTAAAHAILHALNRGVYQVDMTSALRYNKPELSNPFFIAF